MASSLVLRHDQILLPVVGLMIVIDTIAGMTVGVVDVMIVVEAVDGLIGAVAAIDVAIGGVAIETKNNRKYKV
jgi:hypothetical protein